jgi:hypothetical protein
LSREFSQEKVILGFPKLELGRQVRQPGRLLEPEERESYWANNTDSLPLPQVSVSLPILSLPPGFKNRQAVKRSCLPVRPCYRVAVRECLKLAPGVKSYPQKTPHAGSQGLVFSAQGLQLGARTNFRPDSQMGSRALTDFPRADCASRVIACWAQIHSARN